MVVFFFCRRVEEVNDRRKGQYRAPADLNKDDDPPKK